MLAVILVGELQDRLIGLRTKPNDGAANQLIIPHARRDEPRVTDACQLTRSREVDHDLGVRMVLQAGRRHGIARGGFDRLTDDARFVFSPRHEHHFGRLHERAKTHRNHARRHIVDRSEELR